MSWAIIEELRTPVTRRHAVPGHLAKNNKLDKELKGSTDWAKSTILSAET